MVHRQGFSQKSPRSAILKDVISHTDSRKSIRTHFMFWFPIPMPGGFLYFDVS